MECNHRHVIGRSIVLERQERYSFETNERIYLHRHYHNPSFDAARTSSSSDDIEKIHRTRERVEGLSNQINFEIERLKEFNNSLKKDERLMTWDERFRANPPLTNVLNKKHGPGRTDDVSKEVKQKDVSPRKPPPKGISLNRLPPQGEPSPQELPYELTANGLPPKGLPPKGPLPKELSKEITQKITPPMRLPPKELPHKELTYLLLPKKEIPPNRLPLEELNPKKLPPRALPAKESPPKGLALKEVNPRKPTTGALPWKELPPKGPPIKTVLSKGVPPKTLPPKRLPPKGVPPKTIPPKGLPPKNIPPKGLPPKNIPPKGAPPRNTPPKGLLPKTIPPKGVPPKTIPPRWVPLKTTPPKGVQPKTIPSRGIPPKNIPSKEVLPKTIPPIGVLSKTIRRNEVPPKGVPPKNIPPKGVPPKNIPSKEVLPKSIPPKEVPPKGVPPKTLPPKGVPPKTIPPKDLPAKDLLAKRLPLIELPPKKTPLKAPITRKAPPKLSTQKELKPEKPPPKDVAQKKPIPKEEPMQGLGELRSLGDGTPEEPEDARISGGCFNCYCDQCCCPTFEGCCYIETDCNCLEFNQGIQYGIPYRTARRRVTDLNTQEMCSSRRPQNSRCVGISPDRKSSKQCSSIRDSARDKKKSPIRCGRTSPVNKMRNEEKLQKVENHEKVSKVENHEKKVQKVPNLGRRPEKIINEKPPLKKNYQPPVNIKQETPKAPKEDVTKHDAAPIASPTKDQKIYVDERMYEDYLSLYYKENSKTDLLETTPTYTRLPDKSSAKPLRNSVEGQRVSKCFTEMYPGPFRYEECFEEQDYRSPDNNRTEPVSDPHATTPKDCRCPQPTESRPSSPHPKSTRSQDKDRQGVRPEESVMARSPRTSEERSSLTRDWKTDSTSYVSLPVERQSGTPSTRQASATTETQRSKERSSLTYPLDSSEKSTQVYNDRHSNLSSGPPSTRRAYSPTTDSRGQSDSSPISFREGSSRKAYSPTTDSPRHSPISFREGSPRKAHSPTTDSRRQSDSSPISFREGSSRKAHSPTTDSRRQSNSSPISFREGSSQMPQSPTTISNGANSSRIALSQTTDSTRDTTVVKPYYQTEDIDRKYRAYESSDEYHPKYEPRFDMQLPDMDVHETRVKHPIENTDFEDAFSTLSGKTVRSSKEFQDFQDSEMSEAEEPAEEAFRTSPKDSARRQSSQSQDDPKHKYYSTATDDDIHSKCDCNGYKTARSMDSSKRGSDESSPIVRTLCEKRTRTVTFKDEQGDLKKQRQVEEECRSHIDWEPALNYPQYDSTFPNDNYTSRSSSSAEHTCLESSCDEEEDAYDSCFESPCRTDEQRHSFKACPCMYETYRQLADLCQTKSPYYR